MLHMPITRVTSFALLSVVLSAALWPMNMAHAGAVYSYDALGRLVSIRYDDGKQITYQFDAAGNRTQHVTSATTINRPPATGSDSLTILETATQISLDPRANDSDPDGQPLTVFSVTNGVFGSAVVTGSGTGVTYTTTQKRSAVDTLSYVVRDSLGMEMSGEIVITLQNLSPVAVNDAISTPRSATKLFDPRTNDSDPGGDSLTVTAVSTPAHGIATIDGSMISYAPTVGYFGPDTFTYTITDIDGATATATVTVTVT